MDPEVQKALDDMRWEIGLTEVPMKRKTLKKLTTAIYRAANKLNKEDSALAGALFEWHWRLKNLVDYKPERPVHVALDTQCQRSRAGQRQLPGIGAG